MNPQLPELKKIHITFFQWYCNPLEIAVFRTMAILVVTTLATGAFEAMCSKEWAQASLMGIFGTLVITICRRMIRQIYESLRNNGVTYYFREIADCIEIGNSPSKIIRLDRKSLIQRRGVLGVKVVQDMGRCNIIIPQNLLNE